jgi:branched-chain amino acid aminotransferase
VVWINGDLVPEAEAGIPIYGAGNMFGQSVFEMLRTFKGQLFRPQDHLQRLEWSCRVTGIPWDGTSLLTIMRDVMAANQARFRADDEHRVMVQVSAGLPMYGVGQTLIVATVPLRITCRGFGKLFDAGVNAVIPSQRAIPQHLLDPRVKSRSRLHLQMANLEVGDRGWPLLLDPEGHVAEGTGSNFAIVAKGGVFTPMGENVLRGVSMRAIRKYLHIESADITPYDVLTADEAFFTSTPFCLMPCRSLNGQLVGDGRFEYAGKILELWGKDVGVDIAGQFKQWDEADGF